MEFDKVIKLEETGSENFLNGGVKVKKEYGDCIGCFDFQDKLKKANDKCAYLELDIGKKDSVIKCLEGKVGFMELEKLEIVDEVRKLKQRNEELEKSIRDSKEEHDKFTLLMTENRVLEFEKKNVEGDLEVWKVKCKELEVQIMELEKKPSAGITKAGMDSHELCFGKKIHGGCLPSGFNVAGGLPSAAQIETVKNANQGTLPISTPSKHGADMDGFKGGQRCEIKSTVRKGLDFAAESSPLQNFSPSTPGGGPPFGPIYIGDSDDDLEIVHEPVPDVDCKGQGKVKSPSGDAIPLESTLDVGELTLKNKYEPIVEYQSDEEETSCFTAGQPSRTPKRRKLRKGVAHVVISESESDDNVPISRLRGMNRLTRGPVNGSCSGDNTRNLTPRRRLQRVGDIEDKSISGKCSRKCSGNQNNSGISENMNETVLEDEMEEDDSSSEGESLGGFIVESSDVSDCGSGSNGNDMSEHDGSLSGDSSDESESASESSIRYDKIISGFRRERKDKLKWEYESDMLADFGKSAELCMKAICVLYRQQTSEEKSFKATIHRNGRGFNQIHAFSGTALAEFLTDGDPHADMNKTVEELQKFNSKGVEQCQKLATHYSKQLFEIYKNEEDPLFHP
ncbi:hypothetical protein C2S52_008994 [Perilla frutescens var. hirtella]|nr:hypothetical protein C2S52_008994 [Perilla frutescens var. hirtella]